MFEINARKNSRGAETTLQKYWKRFMLDEIV